MGVCTVKYTRWPVKHGYSFETSIEDLQGLSNDDLLNHQVCIALVRMLWHSGPLRRHCQDHLIVNKTNLERRGVWDLMRLIGFKPCNCQEFSIFEGSYDVCCLGNREGSAETEAGFDEAEEAEEVDGDGIV